MADIDAQIAAARVPRSLPPQNFGLWQIRRIRCRTKAEQMQIGFPDFTVLSRATLATMHLKSGRIIMEDSRRELARHLPIWLRAHGRVLITGLGLGCVVRGLLCCPNVEKIDVLEIDRWIIDRIGCEFLHEPRVAILHEDALDYKPRWGERWDFAWHDIWHEETPEALLHTRLFMRFADYCGSQGAWMMPRWIKRKLGGEFYSPTGQFPEKTIARGLA